MRKKMNSGFTLIELMVVVVLVMILSLALVPTFKEIITKAKYSEGTSAISALRTKIKVFYVEFNYLPGLCATFTADKTLSDGVSPLVATVNIDTVDPTTPIVQRLVSSANAVWLIDPQTVSGSARPYSTNDVTRMGASPLQKDLDISFDTYSGAYFSNEDYQYMIINGGKNAETQDAQGYAYAVAVTAGAGQRKPDLGTGYAVMEISNKNYDKNKLSVYTWSRYGADSKNRLYLQLINDLNTAYATDAYIIPVPAWTTLYTGGVYYDGTANATCPNSQLLKDNLGWTF